MSAFTKDEALKSMPVQKQIQASQQTRFKIFATTGTTMVMLVLALSSPRSRPLPLRAIILVKLSIISVQRGHWGSKIGKPHFVPYKVTGYYGSVLVNLIPAPRSADTVSASVPKKILIMAGMGDCYTLAKTSTILGNFAKATFNAISKTYSYLNLNLWKDTAFSSLLNRDSLINL